MGTFSWEATLPVSVLACLYMKVEGAVVVTLTFVWRGCGHHTLKFYVKVV